MKVGGHSMVAPLRTVLLKHPRQAYRSQGSIDGQWEALNYRAACDFEAAIAEFDLLAKALEAAGTEVVFLPEHADTGLDSIYAHDPCFTTDAGLVLGSMGKDARRGEPGALAEWCRENDVPIAGSIESPGKLEGGDCVWVDERTVAVGRGYRTNAAGIEQLSSILGGEVEVVEVHLPHWNGPTDVMHLMSSLSMLADDLALVHRPLLPVPFLEWLAARDIELLDVPGDEYAAMGCNVLALAPRVALTLDGVPETAALLERRGVDVHTYPGDEISRKGGGGPTCLTRPLFRVAGG